MARRSLPPKTWRLSSQIERAKRLAAESTPLVAELYEVHMRICEQKRSAKGERVKPPAAQRPT